MKTVYTLGTDRRSEEDFVEILADYDIRVVVDVRRFARSKMPLFVREYLESFLRHEGILYYHLGVQLGGLRKGGYEAYTRTEDFTQGVSDLEALIADKCAVILCSERFPWKCHRKWIARELHRRGWRVEHIIDKGKVWVPK